MQGMDDSKAKTLGLVDLAVTWPRNGCASAVGERIRAFGITGGRAQFNARPSKIGAAP